MRSGHASTLLAGAVCVPLTTVASLAQDYLPWRETASYRPPTNVQAIVDGMSLPNSFWYVQRIEGASAMQNFGGASDVVNLDYYAVRIKKPPTLDGKLLTAEQTLEHIRRKFSEFIDPATGTVRSRAGEENMWSAGIPGAVMIFTIPPIPSVQVTVPHVVLGEQIPARWRFSTISGGVGSVHPVSGVREFGYKAVGGEFEIYTRGADRVTTAYTVAFGRVLRGGDAMWRGFQQRVLQFVTNNGGTATIVAPVVLRPTWATVSGAIHRPTTPWR
jgi:hypothetical protein